MRQWLLLIAAVGGVVAAGCAVPNPRLCKNDPGCAATLDLAAADLKISVADGPPADAADAAAGPCMGDKDCPGRFCDRGTCQPCTRDAHCGADCRSCAGVAPYCSADGRECVQCKSDADCSSGTFCDGRSCQACNRNDHCGPGCNVCSLSAHPVCSPALKCSCTGTAECGSSMNDSCANGVCQRTCLLASECMTAPAGKKCVNFGLANRCGCSDGGDCPMGTTCMGNLCLCGATLCKPTQTCTAGVCK